MSVQRKRKSYLKQLGTFGVFWSCGFWRTQLLFSEGHLSASGWLPFVIMAIAIANTECQLFYTHPNVLEEGKVSMFGEAGLVNLFLGTRPST